MWMDLEMTKKDMAVKIAELEKQVKELTAALVALSTRPVQPGGYIFIPAPAAPDPNHVPYVPPVQPTWPPYYPYVGDPSNHPTITYNTNVSKQREQTQFVIN